MTKTQISVRVSPDTLAAIDAEAQRQGTSRGHIIDRWLTTVSQWSTQTGRRNVETLLLAAAAANGRALGAGGDSEVWVAVDRIIDALRIITGIDE